MAEVHFTDYSAQVTGAIDRAVNAFLEEAVAEIESEAKRTTPADKAQLRGSWSSSVDGGSHTGVVGSPMEQSLWNEFGTGSHAVNGDGRKGWWVYIEGQGASTKGSNVYGSQAEAEEAAEYIRRRYRLPAVATNGEDPHHTLQAAFASKKDTIIRAAQAALKGL